MRKLLAKALAVITILSFIITNFATNATIAYAAEVDRDAERTTIKVGYLDGYGIITTPIIQGSEGYGYEYLEKIEEYTNYDFEYVPLTWVDGIEKLKTGEIDILAPAAMSDARKETYDFVETPFSYEEAYVYALIDSDYYYGDSSQFNGKILGTIKGGIYEEWFKVYAEKYDLKYTIKYTDYNTIAEDIKSGEIDLYLDSTLLLKDGVHSVDKINSDNLYLMVQKGDDSLKSTLNSALLAIEEDDPFYNEILWSKYYATTHKAIQKFTEDEIYALQSKEVYTVGYHTDLHPSSYTLNGEPKGYAIDVMNILAGKLGIEVRYVPLHGDAENSAENVDFNLNMINYQYSNYGTMSEPYDNVKLLIVRDKGVQKSDVKNILVPDYSTVEINDFLDSYTSATVHKAYSTSDCIRINETVDIDCTIISDTSEMFIEDKANKTIGVLDVSVPIGITVSNKLPIEVRTALNKAILSLEEGTVEELVMENVNALQRSPTLMNILGAYRLQISTVFLLIASAFALTLWKSRKKTKRLLEIDTLTGVMSQYKFAHEAKRILSTAQPNEYMLILLDIDKFKTINKVYGVETGNQLLCILAKSIKRQCEKSVVIGRIQNDAFAILAKTNKISKISIDDLFVEECKMAGIDITVYFSIGVCLIDKPLEDISYMIDNARTAKGYGKTVFGNTINYFTKELQDKQEKEHSIISSMETALAEGEFFIVVQPKVELQTERLVGGEVLVRWMKKDGTFVYPDEFIPLFEENKFITQLDYYVLKKTCEFIHGCKQTLPVLSVNLSAITMLSPDFITYGLQVMDRYGVIPQQIEVELTENTLDYDYKRISKAISDLKKVGFAVAIDDFGKGASSLARIKEVEMDVLKLDKEFIANSTVSEKGKLVLSNVISMANDLGIISLAEGIETEEQKDMLIQLGCEQGQGYYFDRPLSTLDFIQRVEANSKVAYEPVLRYLKDYKFWHNSKDLPYGVAIAKHDQYSTVIHANEGFYDIIGYDKDSFKKKCNNRFVTVLVDNLYNLIQKYLANKQYDFSFDLRIITNSGEIVWAHEIIKYSPEDDLFFVTLFKVANQDPSIDSTAAHVNFLLESNGVADMQEKQDIISEESSKAGLVNMCINMLRTNTSAMDSTATINTVLELLRLHYGAKSCAISYFSQEEQSYEIRYVNIESGDSLNLSAVQNSSFSIIDKIVTLFEKNKYALLKCTTKDFFEAEEDRKIYEKLGVETGYIAPMFDVNNNCNGMLVLSNPSLVTRSPMLIQIVSKFLSDYQVKHDIYVEQQSKIAIEPMTGLLNKVATEEKIEELLQSGQKGTLYMVDVDNFKQINDKLGHVMGDKVIVENAQLLRKIFRSDDIIGRIGGDEFIIYVPELISEQVVRQKAEQILNAFAKIYGESTVQVQISASVGVCVSVESGKTFGQLYQEADKALYHAKTLGKNRFSIAEK